MKRLHSIVYWVAFAVLCTVPHYLAPWTPYFFFALVVCTAGMMAVLWLCEMKGVEQNLGEHEQMVAEIFFKKLWELESGRSQSDGDTLVCQLEKGGEARVRYMDSTFYIQLIGNCTNTGFAGTRLAVANLLGKLGAVPDSATFE